MHCIGLLQTRYKFSVFHREIHEEMLIHETELGKHGSLGVVVMRLNETVLANPTLGFHFSIL